ncbi:hypothetical protein [uncultured Cohaesibacter sp.]|uniref:hypothetical protein n=1 Tax=uncultured Cohaesibacter sp. TaxID=1002546 RepID=UPI0029C82FF9|nr:hypothetical protein [uncultured Cohaesibacter sp.]
MYITNSDQPAARRSPLRALTLLTILSSAVLAGCSSDQMFYTEDPIVARVSKANLKLRELPPPRSASLLRSMNSPTRPANIAKRRPISNCHVLSPKVAQQS